MQDNLEFLQWVKKYWDTYYQGTGKYDAVARRESVGASNALPAPAAKKPLAPVKQSSANSIGAVKKTSEVKPKAAPVTRPPPQQQQQQSSSAKSSVNVDALNKQITELNLNVDQIEKERDFYFNKLRGVEIACQNAVDDEGTPADVREFCQKVMDILYKEETGDEVAEVGSENETY
jgi:RP/EB family microtubule-associated protein